MRYEQQQKGLFTFYKEQEQFEIKIQRLKQQKIQEELLRQQPEINKKPTNHSALNNYSLQKNKVLSQPSSLQYAKSSINRLKQIGNSVIVIKRKDTEVNDVVPTAREINNQEKSKQTGHFVEHKKIDFQQLEQYKISHPLLHHEKKKKRSFLKRREESYSQSRNEEQRRSTKLPTLVKVQENDNEDQIHLSLKSKPIASSLKSQGGNLMRYIRSNLKSQCQVSVQGRQSVSFIQYSKSYLKDNKVKKLDGLNEEQKRLLEVLCRYRNDTN